MATTDYVGRRAGSSETPATHRAYPNVTRTATSVLSFCLRAYPV